MTEQELREKQSILQKEYKEWYDLQAEFDSCLQSKEWHDCEREKERLQVECDSIYRILCEMGCYE